MHRKCLLQFHFQKKKMKKKASQSDCYVGDAQPSTKSQCLYLFSHSLCSSPFLLNTTTLASGRTFLRTLIFFLRATMDRFTNEIVCPKKKLLKKNKWAGGGKRRLKCQVTT